MKDSGLSWVFQTSTLDRVGYSGPVLPHSQSQIRPLSLVCHWTCSCKIFFLMINVLEVIFPSPFLRILYEIPRLSYGSFSVWTFPHGRGFYPKSGITSSIPISSDLPSLSVSQRTRSDLTVLWRTTHDYFKCPFDGTFLTRTWVVLRSTPWVPWVYLGGQILLTTTSIPWKFWGPLRRVPPTMIWMTFPFVGTMGDRKVNANNPLSK